MHGADGFDKNGVELDPFDQEKHFIAESLPRIRDAHPYLKISLEHISTVDAVEYLGRNACETFGASITAHHLLLDRRDVFRGGFRPHLSCMPVIQSSEHKEALRDFLENKKKFRYVWLGSDSAPHSVSNKRKACCANGIMTAHAAIELYAEAFEEMGILDRLEQFASLNGPRFFGVETRDMKIKLVKETWKVNASFHATEAIDNVPADEKTEIVPFRLGEEIKWKLLT
jgi:dihydroorotase